MLDLIKELEAIMKERKVKASRKRVRNAIDIKDRV